MISNNHRLNKIIANTLYDLDNLNINKNYLICDLKYYMNIVEDIKDIEDQYLNYNNSLKRINKIVKEISNIITEINNKRSILRNIINSNVELDKNDLKHIKAVLNMNININATTANRLLKILNNIK